MWLRSMLLTLAACGSAPPPPATLPHSVAPEDRVATYMNASAPGADPSCFAYQRETESTEGTVVAVREIHDAHCGGDPEVEPVIERVRVRGSGQLERYDVANDTWYLVP